MKLTQIYEKPIERTINPAVTVSNRDKEVIQSEIQEYVFTNELIEKLFGFLTTVVTGKSKGTGIWINGYYGSGKSHFIKYVDFCLSEEYKQDAFEHFLKAVKDTDADFSEATPSNVALLKSQLDKMKVETILFNVEDETDDGSGEKLTRIFLNMLHRHRGYNSDNIPLAILFEKELDKHGVFTQFQEKLKEESGFIWKGNEQNLAGYALDSVLSAAKKVAPHLDIASLHARLNHPETYKVGIVSTLIPQLKDYLREKDKNFRLLFLVDEISQYIGKNRELLLNFQSIIEQIGQEMNNQVWIACTAQQTLDNVAHGVGSSDVQDEFGKILGRFPSEYRVSLESSDPAFITKKRVLDKNATGRQSVTKLFRDNRDAIENQFRMHHDLYKGYNSEEEFILSYPFVPYQFRLIADVFDAFQSLQFVIREVKNNERSVLGITHFTAKKNADHEVGYFIPFDAFFNEQFNTNLTHRGRNAKNIATELSYVKNNPLARRVVHILFMISNLSEAVRRTFPSTLENITLLLMSDLDQNRLQLQKDTKAVLDRLKEENVVREENNSYFFFNEDEMDVMMQVQNTTINFEDRLDEFDKIIRPLIKVESKVHFGQNDFKVAYNVDDKMVLQNGNILVKILLYDNNKAEIKSFGNPANCLLLCINEWFGNDELLRKDFELYIKTEKYLRNNGDATEGIRAQTINNFRNRNASAKEKLVSRISQKFAETRFVSGQQVIDPSTVNGTKPSERYQNILMKHMENVYKHHRLAEDYHTTANDLKKNLPAIKAQMLTNNTLSQAEILVNDRINGMSGEMNVADLVFEFSKEPFGWRDIQVIHILVMLYKKKVKDLVYRNQARFPVDQFVEKAFNTAERSALTVKKGAGFDPVDIEKALQNFNEIFNVTLPFKADGNEVFDDMVKKVQETRNLTSGQSEKYVGFPFREPFHQFNEKLVEMEEIRDPQRFFKHLGENKNNLKDLSDLCKQLDGFMAGALPQYIAIRQFMAENQENLTSLTDGHSEKVRWLSEFFKQVNPASDFRTARKMYEELKSELNNVLKHLRDKVEVIYNSVFDSLDNEAEKLKVAQNVYASRKYIIETKRNLNSIASLTLAISQADSFKSVELGKILMDSERQKTPVGVSVSKEPSVTYKPGKAGKYSVIKNESELDEFLSVLREDMLKLLKDRKKIILE